MVVSQGRALAVAAAWIAGPLLVLVPVSFIGNHLDNDWGVWLPMLAVAGVVVLTPIGIGYGLFRSLA